LAEALGPGPDGFEDRYRRNTRELVANIRLKNLKSRIIFNPTLRAAVLRCRLRSIEVYRP
jgi:hypothetical protein